MCVLCRVVLSGNAIVFVLTALVGPGTHGMSCLSAQAVLQRLQGESCVMHAALPEQTMHTGQLQLLYCAGLAVVFLSDLQVLVALHSAASAERLMPDSAQLTPSLSCPAVYRLITAPLVHGGVLHLLFNMLAFVPIASSLERSQGTLHLAALLAVLVLLGNASYVLLASLIQIASTLLSLQ